MENTIYRPVGRAQMGSQVVDLCSLGAFVSIAHTKIQVGAMRAVLDTPSTLIPNGLSIDQMRAFLISHAVKAR